MTISTVLLFDWKAAPALSEDDDPTLMAETAVAASAVEILATR